MIPLENNTLPAILTRTDTVLFKASDTVPLSWGAQLSAYHLAASRSIRPPFNYRAGHEPVFPDHAASHLRPSFNDEESAPGDLGICLIIILLLYVFSVCVCNRGFLIHILHGFYLSHILPSGLSFTVLFHYSSLQLPIHMQGGFTLSLSSELLGLDL